MLCAQVWEKQAHELLAPTCSSLLSICRPSSSGLLSSTTTWKRRPAAAADSSTSSTTCRNSSTHVFVQDAARDQPTNHHTKAEASKLRSQHAKQLHSACLVAAQVAQMGRHQSQCTAARVLSATEHQHTQLDPAAVSGVGAAVVEVELWSLTERLSAGRGSTSTAQQRHARTCE